MKNLRGISQVGCLIFALGLSACKITLVTEVQLAANPNSSGSGTPNSPSSNPSNGPTSLFGSELPQGVTQAEGRGVNLGVKIQPRTDGDLLGVRFYKVPGDFGLHVGQIYDINGSLLAQAAFQNETASGWQEQLFSTKVRLRTGQTYVIAVFSSQGFYYYLNNGFESAKVADALIAPASSAVGGNGVYLYSSTIGFPNLTYNSANYYVDALFQNASPAAPTLTVTPTPVAPSPTPVSTPAPTATPVPTASMTPVPNAGMSSLSFQLVPLSDPEVMGPGRGAETWYGEWRVPIPTEGTTANRSEDFYWRFLWRQIQRDDGSYDWTLFDTQFRRAIDNGQKFNLAVYSFDPAPYSNIDGGELSFPAFVHRQMQAEPIYKDVLINGDWHPNYNAPSYLAAYRALLQAIKNRIDTQSHNGIPFSKALGYVDIRGYGAWGEWNSYNARTLPAGVPTHFITTVSSFNQIIDMHLQIFANQQLVIPIASVIADGAGDASVPAEVGYRILTTRNNVGRIGMRRDCIGQVAFYLANFLENNPTVYNGLVFKDAIMNQWKFAPALGEPCNGETEPSLTSPTGLGPHAYWDMARQIQFYHYASFGNGNYNNISTMEIRNAVREASKLSGYRLVLNGGQYTPTTTQRVASVRLNWRNLGVAPTYENWDVLFELRNSAGATVYSTKSSHQLRLYLPETSDRVVTDTFSVPTTVPAGNYQLHLIIKDPNGYRRPLPLAIVGRLTDGSYRLGTLQVGP